MSPHQIQYTNAELAILFERVASLLQIKGEVVFKVRAYQNVAESLRTLAEDVNSLYAEDRLGEIPGVGEAISKKIEELLTTGKLEFLEKLEQEVPPSLLELLQVPDVGPKRVAMLWKEAGITSLADLAAAAQAHKLEGLPGLGAKSEARILAGIEALSRRTGRMSLEVARSRADEWLDWLRQQPEVQRGEWAGSLRRWKDTIGDLDLIALSDDPAPLLARFTQHPSVVRVLGQGENKASVELRDGTRIQLWSQPASRLGSLWIYATGSKAHNIRLREVAIQHKYSLSERGMEGADGALTEYAQEEDVYRALGMAWIAPELREDRGEVEAALGGKLPDLIEVADIRAELHCHSTWSDGVASIAEMAEAAIQRGRRVLAITDHSASLGIANGLTVERLRQKKAEMEQVQAKLGNRLRLLHGTEVDILADGTIDYPDEILAELDIVIASLHSSLRQPREAVTARLLKAIRNPHVDVIGHPSGRLLPNREGADLDWDVILPAAAQSGIALEINASPYRLDLTDVYARRAIQLGIPLTINTDAHSPNELDLTVYGVSVARRAWASPQHVINAWSVDKLLAWLKGRGTRDS